MFSVQPITATQACFATPRLAPTDLSAEVLIERVVQFGLLPRLLGGTMASPNSGEVGAAGDLLETGLLLAASKQEEAAPPAAVETTTTTTSSGRRLAEHEMTATRSRVRQVVRRAAAQLQEVFLGTKLFPLFSAVPLAVAAEHFSFGRVRIHSKQP